MRLPILPQFAVLVGIGLCAHIGAQESSNRDIEIRRNVYLFETAPPPEIPADLADQYRSFLQVFRRVLRDSTQDQPDANRLILRVAAGTREVGPAKTKRAQARVAAFCRNSKTEYIGNFILYSYVTGDPVNQ